MDGGNWILDPDHSKILFSVKHLVITKVRGSFARFQATLHHLPGNPCKSSVVASIETASIDTGDRHRDEHLRGPDFFNPSAFPMIVFRSTHFSPPGQGDFLIRGELEMHGIKKEVQLRAKGLTEMIQSPSGKMSMHAAATASLNRKDFGLGWSPAIEAGGLTVGEEISIRLELTWLKA